MSVQARGQPAAIVPTITQTPKAIIPAEIKNESTVSMIGPLSSERKQGNSKCAKAAREGFASLLFLTSRNRAWGGRARFGRGCGTSHFRGVCAVSGPNLGPFNRPDELAAHWRFRRCLSERRLLGAFGRWALSECGR
jgi:hypothetical protein